MAKPPGVERGSYYGYWGNYIPLDVLENALKIAQVGRRQGARAFSDRDDAAQSRRRPGTAGARARTNSKPRIKLGKSTDWYDDALYNYAEWMASQGRAVP